MAIYSGITHWKWWFSIVMLVYQRVAPTKTMSSQHILQGFFRDSERAFFFHPSPCQSRLIHASNKVMADIFDLSVDNWSIDIIEIIYRQINGSSTMWSPIDIWSVGNWVHRNHLYLGDHIVEVHLTSHSATSPGDVFPCFFGWYHWWAMRQCRRISWY